jgi:glyoxylase-like metal-dependent hydrolase (beta-lactamase superfamily II)
MRWSPVTRRQDEWVRRSCLEAPNENSQQALDSLQNAERLDASLIIPGHREPWTRGVSEAVLQARSAGFT